MRTALLLFPVLICFCCAPLCGQSPAIPTDSACEAASQYLSAYRYAQALNALGACYQHDPDNLVYLQQKALCYRQLGQLPEARDIYQQMLQRDSTQVQALNRLALVFRREKNLREAANCYQQLIALDSLNSYYQRELASLLQEQGDIVGALAFYQKAYRLNPRDLESIMALGRIYQELKLYPLADSILQEGRALDGNNLALLHLQFRNTYQVKNYQRTLDLGEKILSLSGDSTTALRKLMGIAHFHQGHFEAAVACLTPAVEQSNKPEYLHYYLGLAHRELGHLNRSVEHLEKALEEGITANLAVYYTNLAIS